MSVLLHVGLLAWATLSIQSGREFRVPKHEPMAVSIVTFDELTRLKKGSRSAKSKQAIAKKAKKKNKATKPPKKVVARAVPPSVTPPPPAPEPPPEPPKAAPAKIEPVKEPPPQKDLIAEALKKQKVAKAKAAIAAMALAQQRAQKSRDDKRLAQQAQKELAEQARKKALAKRIVDAKKKKSAAKKKAEAKRKADAKRKRAAKRKKARARKKRLAAKRRAEARKKRLAAARKKKKRRTFDADRTAALLNKLPDDSGREFVDDNPLPREKRRSRAGLGAPEGRDDRLTASEEAVLKSIISRQLAGCWSLPGGGGGTQVASVTLSWRLTRSGRLDGEPRVVRGRNDVMGRIAREAAIRAVKSCAPFRLPPDKYKSWQFIEWEFDPREML